MKVVTVFFALFIAVANTVIMLHDGFELSAGEEYHDLAGGTEYAHQSRSTGHGAASHHCCHFHHSHFYLDPGLTLSSHDSGLPPWHQSYAPSLQLVGDNPPVPPPKA